MDKFTVYYVLQTRTTPWGTNWQTLREKYDTYEAAEAARSKKENPALYRVCEAYYTVKYRPVVKAEAVE